MEIDDDITSQVLSLSSTKKQTLQDVIKEFHVFVKEKTDDVQANLPQILDALGSGTYLQQMFKYQLISKFQLRQEVLSLLLSGDRRLLKQALRCKWFFTELSDPIGFTNNVMPSLTYSARVKVLNKFGSSLQMPETAEKLFGAVHASFSIEDAVSLLPVCGQEFIWAKLWTTKMRPSPRIVLLILKSFPCLVAEYLVFLFKSSHDLSSYKSVLRKFKAHDLSVFMNMCEGNHENVMGLFRSYKPYRHGSFWNIKKEENFKLSKRVTRQLMATLKEEIIVRHAFFEGLWPQKYFFRNLSPDERFSYFVKILPPLPSAFLALSWSHHQIFDQLSATTPKPNADILLSAFKSKYGRDITADEVLFRANQNLLDRLSHSTKVGFMENLSPDTIKSLKGFWLKYLSDEDKIIWIEKQIPELIDVFDHCRLIKEGPISYSMPKLKGLLESQFGADESGWNSSSILDCMIKCLRKESVPSEVKNFCAYIVDKLRAGVLKLSSSHRLSKVPLWTITEVNSDSWDLMKEFTILIGKARGESEQITKEDLKGIFQRRLALCFSVGEDVKPLLDEYKSTLSASGDLEPRILSQHHECLSWFLSQVPEMRWTTADNEKAFISKLLSLVAEWNRQPSNCAISLPDWASRCLEDFILQSLKKCGSVYSVLHQLELYFPGPSSDRFNFLRKYFGRVPPDAQLKVSLLVLQGAKCNSNHEQVPEWIWNYIKFACNAPSCLLREHIQQLVNLFVSDIDKWREELKKLFPYYPDCSLLIYFLRNEPDFILDNMRIIIEHDLKGFYRRHVSSQPLFIPSRQKKKIIDSGKGVLGLQYFYKKCRLYGPFGLQNKIIQICKFILKSKNESRTTDNSPILKPEAKRLAVRIAALMYPSSSYSRLIPRFIPPKGKKARTKAKAKAIEQIQHAICDSLLEVSNPSELLKENFIACFLLKPETFKGFCYRVSPSQIIPMLKDRTLWPDSFQKQIPFLINEIDPRGDAGGPVFEFFKNEENVSIRLAIFERFLKKLKRDENELTLSRFMSVVCLLKAGDATASKKLFWHWSLRATALHQQYLEMLWVLSQNELSDLLADAKDQFVSYFIIHPSFITIFNDNYLDVLVSHDLSRSQSSSNSRVSRFVVYCLLYSNSLEAQSSRLAKVVNTLQPLIASLGVYDLTDASAFNARAIVQNFFTTFYDSTSHCEHTPISPTGLVLKIKEIFSQLIVPEQFLGQSILLDLALLKHRTSGNGAPEFANAVSTLFISYFQDSWNTYGSALASVLLQWSMKQFTYSKKDKLLFRRTLALELVSNDFYPCQMFAIQVLRSLPKTVAHSDKEGKETTKIIERLTSSEHSQVRAAAHEWFLSLEGMKPDVKDVESPKSHCYILSPSYAPHSSDCD